MRHRLRGLICLECGEATAPDRTYCPLCQRLKQRIIDVANTLRETGQRQEIDFSQAPIARRYGSEAAMFLLGERERDAIDFTEAPIARRYGIPQ